ncbi:MAG: alkaline phosphatase D family protein [Planctomycetota bacterium]
MFRPLPLLALGCLTALGAAPATAQVSPLSQASEVLTSSPFPLRVAAGDVTQTSAVVWATSPDTATLRLVVATDAAFETVVFDQTVETGGLLRPSKAELSNLTAGTQYWYRVSDANDNSDQGTFRTPHAPTAKHGLRFGISGDGRGDQLPFHSIANVPERDLDFFVYLGDTIYADITSPILPEVEFATTVREFALKHAEVNASNEDGFNFLGDLRTSTAVFASIDDHEVINDFAGGAAPKSDPRFDQNGAFINETLLFSAGLRGFINAYPMRDLRYGDTGDPRTAFKRKLYRAVDFGQDASLFVLDARSFRDEPLPPVVDPTNLLEVSAFLLASFDPTRTMLGDVQVEDLKADLLAAHEQGVEWKIVCVPEPIQNLGVLAASDRFEGYAAERTEILSFVDENEIDNVVFVCADIHGTVINNLEYEPGLGQPGVSTNAFEISTGSVAFADPFGPTVIFLAFDQGLVSQEELDLYLSLPIPAQDQFLKTTIDANITPFGYPAIGLESTPVNAELLAGDYIAVHTWGWTEFEIDPETSVLTISTWGITPGTDETPAVVSQFRVTPQ